MLNNYRFGNFRTDRGVPAATIIVEITGLSMQWARSGGGAMAVQHGAGRPFRVGSRSGPPGVGGSA